MKTIYLLSLFLWVAGCAPVPETQRPGRGAERETGPLVKVYPAGEAPRMARHGLWRGMNGDQVVWELRYTRGVPSGPYREWDAAGEMIATWPYNWEGQIEGWARWFEEGKAGFKAQVDPLQQPGFDPVGDAAALREWLRQKAEKVDAAAEAE